MDTTAEKSTSSLPDVATIDVSAPFGWLAGAWKDMWSAPGPFLFYGVGLALVSVGLTLALFYSGAADWIMVLAGGFLFVAPMLAMGLYEAGRRLELGEKPSLGQMLFVKTASTRDLAYLGLALLLVYFFWGRIAQLVYALSTYRKHETVREFFTFMLTEPEGQAMAMTGTVIGGIIAFIAFALVVISAPMLLERRTEVFVATLTSVRSVINNPLPMLIWAALIAGLTVLGMITAYVGLIVVFPWIGLASWRAYRELAPGV